MPAEGFAAVVPARGSQQRGLFLLPSRFLFVATDLGLFLRWALRFDCHDVVLLFFVFSHLRHIDFTESNFMMSMNGAAANK